MKNTALPNTNIFEVPFFLTSMIKGAAANKTKSKASLRAKQAGPFVKKNGAKAKLILLSPHEDKSFESLVGENLLLWQKKQTDLSKKESFHFLTKSGPIWIAKGKRNPDRVSHYGKLEESSYSQFRDLAGALYLQIKSFQPSELDIEFIGLTDEQIVGSLVGIEMASYQFKDLLKNKELTNCKLNLVLSELESRGTKRKTQNAALKNANSTRLEELLSRASHLGHSINLARHWVNLPPNILQSESFANYFKKLKPISGLQIDIWDENRLKKEKMNLHLAVGAGSEHAPRLVHLKWRPAGSKNKETIAFVGKGVTFDTGGLDIKPSAGMRLMKKDMGGASTVLALGLWAAQAGLDQPLDVFAALAENSIDGKSFLPSDVIRARSGMDVEIDNTDAEGRLVLADSLDYAVTELKPRHVIDVATLTGAIKVGLGTDISGLFSNDDALALALETAGQQMGELTWRMPLFEKYWSSMNSSFADCKNSGDSFGGAITAALFLSKFIKGQSWAHFDIYGWSDKPSGAISAAGGSGQAVQTLAKWLDSL